jgi:hypothetical protein
MKSIILHTAVCDNGGYRREAGAQIPIGDDKLQISAERAIALVADGSVIEAAPSAKAEPKGETAAPDKAA